MIEFNNPRKNNNQYNDKELNKFENGRWYVSIIGTADYLHNDLVTRNSAYHGSEPKGYYKTRKLAWEAIKAYKEKHGTK